ncbi:L-glutamate gamma-semialdehyde dehydrogenase [Cognatishimia sp. 1_MG-2023]|uniref:L-glutamate gamma-semialdehyde dehydrogenase n=1 Tax=Cognatishimia sp. 1_MG-2023 TaxID=3062642 RepID=UPI0026E32E41|nr:L-glutamate gamma-semialdehyde dehydrogenase [Cognatishimia sp. 1_MG-2023]MDO6728242.1 L-glutamate gamma-semialdehyde dehydrogenase [Cognatishimia sp. 1_MG-2023]
MQPVINEPIFEYRPGSPERQDLQRAIEELKQLKVDIPLRIGGERVSSKRTYNCVMPHNHSHVLGQFHCADAEHATSAVEAAAKAHPIWSKMPLEDRARVFLKAADLLAGPWRAKLNAATMLGQGKTAHQAEIDSACELIDFLRFNVQFARDIYANQPISGPGCQNRSEYRALEGFIFALTPFNFTAIAGNLCVAPAIMGNTIVWKPSERAVYSANLLMDLFEEAGLPPGVINMIPSDVPEPISNVLLSHPDFAGLHFTGSTRVFQLLWQQISENIGNYRNYPRIVGETGGKDFIFAHSSAHVDALVTSMVRGAFEYQGQKCSAASRAYVPASLWDEVVTKLKSQVESIKIGAVTDFSNFMSAVIDDRSFANIASYIDHAKNSEDHDILVGGTYDDSEGYFVQPTVVIAHKPNTKLMTEEIFGPVLTIHKYDDDKLDEALTACDTATPYGLTGAIFATDRTTICELTERLKHSAGNFYVNDKPTGAVVGQQPFGGGRASGTNDKAGSMWNLIRWVTPRTIKETYDPATDYRYPSMLPDNTSE